MKNVLGFGFIPRSADFALLVLRLGFGLSLLLLHGWGKLMRFSEIVDKFPDPLHVGHTASLVLAIFGEVVCSSLLVLGLLSRFAALGAAITMGVAFFLVHGMKLKGQGSGEDAMIYLTVFVALFIAGPGRYSVDGGGK